MAVSNIQDITVSFNANGFHNMDIGGWDFAVVQLVSPSGTINFLNSNDSGDITSVSDGSAVSATNFIPVTGTNLSSNTGVTSLNTSGLVKFNGVGRYLRLSGAGITASKILVRLYKTF